MKDHRAAFDVVPDGRLRTYEVDIAAVPAYAGIITRLRLDPVFGGSPGESMELPSISWRPPASP